MDPIATVPEPDRFEVLRPLGSGGFGDVWAVHDRARGLDVALKRLRRLGPDALLRFKREFRALADLHHPNLVRLYELRSEGDAWYYTMELVDGATALDRTTSSSGLAETWRVSSMDDDSSEDPLPPLALGALDPDRVRSLFRQLAEGLAALHDGGRLHRDLKPGNVLVTPEGRVVILDFGLVGDRDAGEVLRAGTPAYMAPEQIDGAATTASDWYAFGLMLYEALTGERPFRGAATQMLANRRSFDGPDPREIAASAPADLAALCGRLLRREPAERPAQTEILATFGYTAAPGEALAFVGREAELAALESAWSTLPALVTIRGASGMGKSALVRQFLEAHPERTTLRGRCWERESVPFKALDGVVDELARRLPAHTRLPSGLARLFPVLAPFSDGEPELPDPYEERRRAARALGGLLGAVAPAVVWIDDAHWGDGDSVGLLREMLLDPPAILLLTTARAEAGGELPAALVGLAPRFAKAVTLDLAGLGDDDARKLVSTAVRGDQGRVEALLHEARGHPMFLAALARARDGVVGTSLAGVILGQVAALDAPARGLLGLLALAGRPLPRSVAREASGLGPAFEPAFAALESGRFIRFDGMEAGDTVEPYHDRIRETVAADLPAADAVAAHRALADALSDPEERLPHLRGAGRTSEAAACAEAAADRAAAALAFDHAAALYAQAIELGKAELLSKMGDALSHAGRGEAAAAAYLAAAEATNEPGALQTRAAEEYLNAGHLSRGLQVLDTVLAPMGMRIAPSPWMAFAAVGLFRARLALRGLDTVVRPADQVPPELLRSIDACWSAATGLAVIDTARGSEFQMRMLWLALQAGEPYRLVCALALEIAFLSTSGPRTRPQVDAVLARAAKLAGQVDDPHAAALVDTCDAIRVYLEGGYPAAVEPLARCEERMRRLGGGAAWGLNTTRIFRIDSLRWAGRWAELGARSAAYTTEAEDTGNLHLRTYMAFADAATLAPARDEPARGRAVMREAIGWWGDESYRVQHWWAWYAFVDLDLYEGRDAEAWALAQKEWSRLRWSLLLAVEVIRVFSNYLRGKAALAYAGTGGPGRFAAMATARWDLAMLRSSRCHHARLMEQLLAADLAAVSGDEKGLRAALTAAVTVADRDGYAMIGASARRALGLVVGGDEGAEGVTAAEAAMRAEGVRAPASLMRMYLPSTTRFLQR